MSQTPQHRIPKNKQLNKRTKNTSNRPVAAGGGGGLSTPPSHASLVGRRPRHRNRTLHLLNRTSILTILVDLTPG